MLLSKFAPALIALAALATPSFSATLNGDTVGIDINDGTVVTTALVGPGVDKTIAELEFDFNGGVNGDEFSLSAPRNFSSVSGGVPLKFTFDSLDFSGGEILVGFADLFSVFSNTVASVDNGKLIISFDDGAGSAGTIISGRYITAASQVPLPAGLPLLLSGFGALALMRRRKRAAA